MSIDLTLEQGLTPARAARLVPPLRQRRDPSGHLEPVPTHPSTIVRWIVSGVRARDGSLVRLEAIRVGGRWVTTARCLTAFAARLTAAQTVPACQPAARPLSPARRRDVEAAARELDEIGI
jgi:hypothetical protein